VYGEGCGTAMSKARPPVEVSEDVVLTQFGNADGGFRSRPFPGETELSTLLGRLTPLQAVTCISKAPVAVPGDGIRCTTAGTLRELGFTVASTPEKANPLHVSVTVDKEWDEEVENKFSSAMELPIWQEEEPHG